MLAVTKGDPLTVEFLPSLDRSTLRDRTLHALRAAITSGQYRPGDHLGEADLAAHLGVSRGTVRQALRHLQHEGLVTAGHRSMLRVNSLTTVEVRELFRVRAALEGLAARQISSSADRNPAVNDLREALARLADPGADFTGLIDADLGFHLLLCQLSDNGVLVNTWRHLEGRIRLVIMAAGALRAQPFMSLDRYEPIVDSIEDGDSAAAVDAINRYMSTAANQLAVGSRSRW
jgi:DNA-binding GntR family transcriptional regulator